MRFRTIFLCVSIKYFFAFLAHFLIDALRFRNTALHLMTAVGFCRLTTPPVSTENIILQCLRLLCNRIIAGDGDALCMCIIMLVGISGPTLLLLLPKLNKETDIAFHRCVYPIFTVRSRFES